MTTNAHEAQDSAEPIAGALGSLCWEVGELYDEIRHEAAALAGQVADARREKTRALNSYATGNGATRREVDELEARARQLERHLKQVNKLLEEIRIDLLVMERDLLRKVRHWSYAWRVVPTR